MSSFRLTDTHVYFLGSYFSQWPNSPFSGSLPALRATSGGARLAKVGSLRFSCAEQFMMASKASIFGDNDTMIAIMDAKEPREQKALGRQVQNFNVDVWNAVARDVVYIGNYYKFTQHLGAKKFMEETKDKIIVEGADYDPIWGVGVAWDDPAIEDTANWKGTNWLGECIMRVREDIAAHGDQADPFMLRRPWP